VGTSVIAGARSMSKNLSQFFNSFQIRANCGSELCPKKPATTFDNNKKNNNNNNKTIFFINIKKHFDTKVKECFYVKDKIS